MMREAIHIATLVVMSGLMTGCGSPDGKTTAADSGHDASTVKRDADVDADAGSSIGDMVTRDASDVPTGACEDLGEEACFLREDCLFDGQGCMEPPAARPAMTPVTGQLPGLIRLRNHPSLGGGARAVTMTSFRIDDALTGTLSIDDGSGDWATLQLDGEVDRQAGTMSLELFADDCFVGASSCGSHRLVYELSGVFDGEQWLFPNATRVGVTAEFPRLANLRFQPNDGVKPVNIPERSETFTGPTASVSDSFLPAVDTCTLVFDSNTIETAEPLRIECEDGTLIDPTGSTRVLPQTFAYLALDETYGRLWFQLETPETTVTFVGYDSFNSLSGVFAADSGAYYDGGDPIDPRDVAPEDILSTGVFFPDEP